MILFKTQFTKKFILIISLFVSLIMFIFVLNYYKDKPVYSVLNLKIPEAELTDFSKDFTSNIPIIEIEAKGDLRNYNNPAVGTMRVFNNNNGINKLSGSPSVKITKMNIHIRGNSSFGFNKKGYHVRLQNVRNGNLKYPLLGYPPDSNWVFHGPYADKSLIRNYFAFNLGNQMTEYCSRAEFFELWLREPGKKLTSSTYMGVYVLLEKIKISPDRINIKDFKMADSYKNWFEEGGGYIYRRDHMDNKEEGKIFTTERGDTLTIYRPNNEDLTNKVFNYIAEEVQYFEDIIYDNKYLSEKKGGIAKYIDIDSFINTFALNELVKSVDGGRLSTYYYRDVGGKLVCGPVWDFDLSAGNADYNDNEDYKGFCVLHTLAYKELTKRKAFLDLFKERWLELRKNEFSDDNIIALIEKAKEQLEPVQQRNFNRWPELFDGKTYVWPNPAPYTTSWEQEIKNFKNYILKRAKWLDNNIDNLYERVVNYND